MASGGSVVAAKVAGGKLTGGTPVSALATAKAAPAVGEKRVAAEAADSDDEEDEDEDEDEAGSEEVDEEEQQGQAAAAAQRAAEPRSGGQRRITRSMVPDVTEDTSC